MISGPPGTGKTTTIAAASRIWDLCDFPVWIVAHSNVAVKNIAETLFKKKVDFKLIVSKEFYVEWYVQPDPFHPLRCSITTFLVTRHEHLYCEIQEKVRRSDELPTEKVAMERELGGSHIILSTLSMISNPSLHDNGTFDIIPVERLVIDEASQINIFEFMVSNYFPLPPFQALSPLVRCSTYLFGFNQYFRKFVFSATPSSVSCSPAFNPQLSKQIKVPPFGQDKAPSIKTIFDLTSRPKDFFLNTQCLQISLYSFPCLIPLSACRQDAATHW